MPKDKKIKIEDINKKIEKGNYDFHPDAAIKKFLTEISHPRLIGIINGILKTDYPTDSQVSFGKTEYFSALGDLDKGSVRGDLVVALNPEEEKETTHKIVIELQTTVDESMGFRMFIYSLNVSEKQKKEQIYVFPKAFTLYTVLDKPERGFDQVQMELEHFSVGEQEFSAEGGDLLTVSFPYYNVLATDFDDFQGSSLELLKLLWLYRYRKNPSLLQNIPELEKVLRALNDFVLQEEGADQLVLRGLFTDLIKDVEKICKKQAYEKELEIVNVLNQTYSEFLMSEGMELGVEKGIGIGKEQGIGIGALRKQREIAKKMLDFCTLEQISQSTNLSLEEIQALAHEV